MSVCITIGIILCGMFCLGAFLGWCVRKRHEDNAGKETNKEAIQKMDDEGEKMERHEKFKWESEGWGDLH